jgi:hypothetical protein
MAHGGIEGKYNRFWPFSYKEQYGFNGAISIGYFEATRGYVIYSYTYPRGASK